MRSLLLISVEDSKSSGILHFVSQFVVPELLTQIFSNTVNIKRLFYIDS